MKILLAKTAGFCMGVKQALEKALQATRGSQDPLFTHGPLIHNRQVVEMLREKGMEPREDFSGISEGKVIIRAHGVPPGELDALEKQRLEIVDATCPHVKLAQRRIREFLASGLEIVIAGEVDHPEVKGLLGHARNRAHVILTPAAARQLPPDRRYGLLAQTTFNEETFREIVATLREHAAAPPTVFDSICRATHNRQEEIRTLSRQADAILVVGGKDSANTKRLAAIAGETGKPVHWVETAAELRSEDFTGVRTVAVTAGASTPQWIINQAMDWLTDRGAIPEGPSRPSLLAALVRSNLFSAGGAALLTVLVTRWMQLPLRLIDPFMAFAFIFSVVNLIHLKVSGASGAALPERVRFKTRYRLHHWIPSLILVGLAIFLAWNRRGLWAMGLLGVMFFLGWSYDRAIFPPAFKWRRLRDLPLSKDLLTAVGWSAITVIIPAVVGRPGDPDWPALVSLSFLVFCLILQRAIIVDLGDLERDRPLGHETLPLWLGEEKTARLGLVLGLLLPLLAGGLVALRYLALPALGFVFLPLYNALIIRYHKTFASEEWRNGLAVDAGYYLLALVFLTLC